MRAKIIAVGKIGLRVLGVGAAMSSVALLGPPVAIGATEIVGPRSGLVVDSYRPFTPAELVAMAEQTPISGAAYYVGGLSSGSAELYLGIPRRFGVDTEVLNAPARGYADYDRSVRARFAEAKMSFALYPIWVDRQSPCKRRGYFDPDYAIPTFMTGADGKAARERNRVVADGAARAAGVESARRAIRILSATGVPADAVVFLDVEDIVQDGRRGQLRATRSDCVRSASAFVAGWNETLRAGGYRPGLYSGRRFLDVFVPMAIEGREAARTDVPDAIWRERLGSVRFAVRATAITPSASRITGVSVTSARMARIGKGAKAFTMDSGFQFSTTKLLRLSTRAAPYVVDYNCFSLPGPGGRPIRSRSITLTNQRVWAPTLRVDEGTNPSLGDDVIGVPVRRRGADRVAALARWRRLHGSAPVLDSWPGLWTRFAPDGERRNATIATTDQIDFSVTCNADIG